MNAAPFAALFRSYVHHVDPIIVTLAGVHLWWYGLSYTLGFLNAHSYLRRRREQFGFSARSVYNLSLLLAVGVLLGGRLVEVIFYEWPFYHAHLSLIPAYWVGGMATHGLLLGGLVGVWIFARLEQRPFLSVTDALAIPTAVIMGLGRIGNFIDGQIVGSVTSVWWAVKFPDSEGFRHPVVLYDGLKNLLIVPILIFVGRRYLPQGARTGIFLFLYAFLRIFVDVFREYPTTLFGLATGQVLNLLLSVLGLGLIVISFRKRSEYAGLCVPSLSAAQKNSPLGSLLWRRFLFAAILLFALTMPSDWTQDVPARYGRRHPGLHYTWLYPRIWAAPAGDTANAGAAAKSGAAASVAAEAGGF
jgi:phosphatidylglycerol:prolipoprotein diacylglycerol transferase